MAVATITSATVLVGTAWTGTAPGAPGTQTVSGTITTSTNLSAWATQIDIPFDTAMVDATNFASGGFTINVAGLFSGVATITFLQDYAASAPYITLAAAALAKTLMYVDINPTSGARSATNPSCVIAGYMSNFNFLAATVGEVATLAVPFTLTGKPAFLIA